MKHRTLIYAFLLAILGSVAITVNAGSSATAITTITANIVPAASFSVSAPILLSQQSVNKPLIATTSQHQNSSKSVIPNSIILRTNDTQSPAKFSAKSSQNLAYDISMSSHVSATDNKINITADINHTLDVHGQHNNNDEHELIINGLVMDTADQDTGIYHGLIDITINYN
jgi:hypothetical protein